MYEPLVDIDGSKLKELYKDVKDLGPKKIWKHKPVKKVTKKDVNIPA